MVNPAIVVPILQAAQTCPFVRVILGVSHPGYQADTQDPATVVKLPARLAGPFVVVVQVYPALVAVMVLQTDPELLVVVKLPLTSAVTLVPQTLMVAPLALTQNHPETV